MLDDGWVTGEVDGHGCFEAPFGVNFAFDAVMFVWVVVGEVDGEVVELAFEGAVAEGAVFVELVGVPALATDNLVTRHRL